jgi:hypothetical protein
MSETAQERQEYESWTKYGTLEREDLKPRRGCNTKWCICVGFVVCMAAGITTLDFIYQGADERYMAAMAVATKLKQLDTSKNKISVWLRDEKDADRLSKRGLEKPSVLPGPGIKDKKFAWTWPNGSPPPEQKAAKTGGVVHGSLRLPVGIAASLMLARYEARTDDSRGRARTTAQSNDLQVRIIAPLPG